MLGPRFARLIALLCVLVIPVLAQDCSANKPCATGCCSRDGYCGTTPEHCGEGCLANCNFKLGCDANNPCAQGCCNNFGFCGHGPDFCGKDVCVNNCDRRAECDPGFGSEWATSSSCPLNVCCSDFGYCGTTKEFCGNKTVKHETCSKNRYLDRVVGYYEGWSTRRPCHQFWPEQIPLGVYSHINFAFATIDPDTYEVLPADNRDKELYKRVTGLKAYDPNVEVLIALGGWTFNDPGPTSSIFSDLAASETKQKKFFDSLSRFLSTYNFDGVDLDWEYPRADDRGGKPEDFRNFPNFLRNLKKALDGTGGRNTLSITLPASYWYLQHFDLKALAKHVSFFNIMSYDMHGTWDQGNKWTGSFLNAHTNLTEIKQSLDLLWRNDVKGDQVVMGLAFYGRTYTTVGDCVEPGCVYASGGLPGKCSHETGILLNSEIMDIVNARKLESRLYKDAAVKVVNWDDQWVSIDDRETLQLKTDFAREQCLSGVMVWAISHDTPTGDFSRDLAKVSNRQIMMQFDQIDNDTWTEKTEHNQCRWTNCGEACPAGWSMVERADEWKTYKGQPMIDSTYCMGHGYSSWCCPPESPLPKCGWYGFNKGRCKAGCPDGMLEIASTGEGCEFSMPQQYQSGCCSPVGDDGKELSSMTLYNTCEWSKEWPNCDDGACSGTRDTLLGESSRGTGVTPCAPRRLFNGSQQRKLCCDTSQKNRKFENCQWHNGTGLIHPISANMRCWSGCPDGQIRVSLDDPGDCRFAGAQALCCDGADYTETEHLSDELQQFQEDLADWLTNVECVLHLSKRDLGLEARGDLCEIVAKHTLVIHLAAIISGYLYQEGRTSHYNRLVNEWNVVSNTFEHLSTRFMLPWITSNDTYPEFYQQGFEVTARRILWAPDHYDRMIAGSKSSIYCTQDLCDYNDGMCERDEDTLELVRRNFEWKDKKDALMHLEKRANVKKEEVQCTDEKGEKPIKYTRFAYPGSTKWPLKTACAQEAVDFKEEESCTTTEVVERAATADDLKPGDNNGAPRINTEHLVELKLMAGFIQWAATDADCQVDCAFFADFFTQEVIEGAPKTPGNSQNLKRPIDRVMEQFGTNSNKEVFRLLRQSINVVKGDLWDISKVIPGKPGEWPNMVQSDNPRKALELIRDTITVYNYQNLPKVLKRFKMVNDGIRSELNRAAKAYKDKFGKDINLVDCWDRFFKERKNSMVANGHHFVTTAIDEMRSRWTHDPAATADWNSRAQETRDQLDQLGGHIGEIYMDDLRIEKLV